MNASTVPSSSRLLFDELLLRPHLRLRIGEHVVDVGALRLLTRPAHPRLTSKALAVLIELARHAGETVTRDRLLERVWAGRITTDDVLTQAIKELRRAFLDDAKPSRYIETIPRVGYRLLAPVGALEDDAIVTDPAALAPAENDPVHDAPAPLAASAASGTRMPWRWLAALVAVLAIALVGFVRWPDSSAAADASWHVSDVRVVTSDPGVERRPAVSPDGTRVAYGQLDPASGVDRIMLRAIGQSDSIRLTTKPSTFEESPMWSPDGTQIAFERLDGEHCTMHIASSVGGSEREVGECGNYIINYFDWTPDGKALITADQPAYGVGMTLLRWDLASGVRQPLQYARAPADQDLEAHYSPDGKWIVFRRGFAPFSDLYVMQADGGNVRQLTHIAARIRGLTWTADSRRLVFASNFEGRFLLYGMHLDDAHPHALDVGPAEYPLAARAADTIVYEIPRTVNRLAQIALDRDEATPELLAKSTGSDGAPALSPDGKRIAFVSDRSGTQQIWLDDLASNSTSALTEYRDAVLLRPTWNADGKRLLVTVRGADPRLDEIELATRRERRVSRAGLKIMSGYYGPEPDSYVVVVGNERQNQLVLLRHAGSAAETQMLLASGVEHAEFDPLRQRVYYTKDSHGGLYLRDLAGSDEQLVTMAVGPGIMDGWRLVDERIWFVSRMGWKPLDILEFDPATAKQRVVKHLDAELQDVNFSVSATRDRIVLTPLGIEDTDIGSFRLRAMRR